MTTETTLPRKKPVTGRTRAVVIALDRGILFFACHWVAFANAFIAIYIGLPFLAPMLMKQGYEFPAKIIYTVYSPMCHQLAYRSWFLFGEQSAYPRDVFEQYTGIDVTSTGRGLYEQGLWDARNFVGNERVGYKVALCERDTGIYLSILIFGLVYSFPFVRRRVSPLPWLVWGLLGIAPIALDGFSQLLSQYPFNVYGFADWLPYRESTPLLRSFTGALFGLANVWLAYPYVEQSMREGRVELEEKLARVDQKSEVSSQ